MRRVVTTFCVVSLAGCADLSAVSDVSTRLSTASATWNDVSGEFAASCERERLINPQLNNCNLEKTASAGLVGANTILSDYFKALRSVANEANFTVKPGLEAATKSVVAIPGINQDQVKAVSGIFSLLTRLALDGVREATLRRLIDEGAPAAQTVVRGLDDLVVRRLSGRLDTERFQLTGHFARMMLSAGDSVGGDPSELCSGPAAAGFSETGYLLSLEYCRRVAVLDRRVAALTEYRTSLKKADEALAELRSAKSKLKAETLAKRLAEIGSDLDESVAAVRKAFG